MANSTTIPLASTFGLQPAWQSIVETHSPQAIEFFGTLIVQVFSFWSVSVAYFLLDIVAPSFSHRHKIQPIPKQPNAPELLDCLLVVLRNQLFSTVVHALLLTSIYYGLGQSSSYHISLSLPALRDIAWQLPVCFLIREVLFYFSHRLLHQPLFYAPIHKFHHRFTAPVALAAEYAHPVEHLIANMLPVSLPPQIVGAHILTSWLFLASVLLETATVHSGYDFAGGAAAMHDLHHEKFIVNFGTLGLLDKWLGTYKVKGEKTAKVAVD